MYELTKLKVKRETKTGGLKEIKEFPYCHERFPIGDIKAIPLFPKSNRLDGITTFIFNLAKKGSDIDGDNTTTISDSDL